MHRPFTRRKYIECVIMSVRNAFQSECIESFCVCLTGTLFVLSVRNAFRSVCQECFSVCLTGTLFSLSVCLSGKLLGLCHRNAFGSVWLSGILFGLSDRNALLVCLSVSVCLECYLVCLSLSVGTAFWSVSHKQLSVGNSFEVNRGRIFSRLRPFYERAVSDLDRSMHRSLWV
jgi:hypothetical protein